MAFGSLLVAAVQCFKLLMMGSKNGRQALMGHANPAQFRAGGGVCGAIVGLLEMYNQYAYTEVAIYGYSYRA